MRDVAGYFCFEDRAGASRGYVFIRFFLVGILGCFSSRFFGRVVAFWCEFLEGYEGGGFLCLRVVEVVSFC